MKLGHAAALAIIAWWLILPPLTDDRAQIRPNVPLIEWPVFGKFDSEQECEKQEVWLAGYLDGHLRTAVSTHDDLLRQFKSQMRCIDVPQIAPD